MINGNGGRQWTIWTAGILGTIILTALTMTINSVVANDTNSRERDDRLTIRATSNEVRINRLEECQIAIKEQLVEIKAQNLKQTEKLDKILQKVQ